MVAELTASRQRSQDPHFVASLSFPSLLDKLPLSLPVVADTPPSPKPHYRSQYAYLGYKDPLDPAVWSTLSLFDLALRLIDFSSLEAPLAQIIYASSAKGHVPFHPVSMCLLHSWRIDSKWNRAEVLRNLDKDCYDDYRQRFGFAKGVYPTEGGLLSANAPEDEEATEQMKRIGQPRPPQEGHTLNREKALIGRVVLPDLTIPSQLSKG
ncbi:MAG: hypothetical protein M1358_09995 [Chloroflexi bacterium]|nr:hypothetical protein [Chloroflexota bacterium]